MKRLLAVTILVLAGALGAQAQKVEVDQSFVDSANKAFQEVIALREAVAAQKETIAAKNEVITAKNDVIKEKNETIRIREEQIENYRKIKCDKTSYLFGLIKSTRCN